jgi:L-ribulose-5-phosphate 3-epimerase
MAVGVLAHLCGQWPYKELPARIRAAGLHRVQLAMWKAISDIDFNQPGRLSPGLAQDIAEEFFKHDVSISVLGCYVHLFERDEDKRRHNVARFKELLRYARLLGAPMVAAESGVNPGGDYDDRDWRNMKATLEELVEEAEKWGVFIGLEPADQHLLGDTRTMRQMIDEVPSSNIGIVLDPGNLLTADNFYKQDQVIEEAFQLLGDRIIACHAKDRILVDGRLDSVGAGQGQMNYPLFLQLLGQIKPNVDIIMEHVEPEEMQRSKQFIENLQEPM